MRDNVIILLIMFSLSAYSQQDFKFETEIIEGVCGVKFGDNLNTAKVKLKHYFEQQDELLCQKVNHSQILIGKTIQYMNESCWGIRFDNMYFDFDDHEKFNRASFWIYCKNKKTAKERLTELAFTLYRYYILYNFYDEDNIPFIYGGFVDQDINHSRLRLTIDNKDVLLMFMLRK